MTLTVIYIFFSTILSAIRIISKPGSVRPREKEIRRIITRGGGFHAELCIDKTPYMHASAWRIVGRRLLLSKARRYRVIELRRKHVYIRA